MWDSWIDGGLALLLVLVLITDFAVFRYYSNFLRLLMRWTRESYLPEVQKDWTLLATGQSSDPELEKLYLSAAQKMFETFCAKNHDYGSKNVALGGEKGIVLRMSDKMSRLWTGVGLSGDGTLHVSDETRKDTYLDMCNYAMFGYLLAQGVWPKVKIDDVFGDKALAAVLLDLIGNENAETDLT